jgi:hypothetical protein
MFVPHVIDGTLPELEYCGDESIRIEYWEVSRSEISIASFALWAFVLVYIGYDAVVKLIIMRRTFA